MRSSCYTSRRVVLQARVPFKPTAPVPRASGHQTSPTTHRSSVAPSSTTDVEQSGASSTVGSPATSTSEPGVSLKAEARLTLEQYREIYDRLIKIFEERPREDWKKLIVFSKQWSQHKKGVMDRVRELGDSEEVVEKKLGYRRLFRALYSVAEEVERYNAMLDKFLTAREEEWEAIVAVYRGDLQQGFFEHLQCLVVAAKDDESRKEALVVTNARLVALCSSHDSITANAKEMEAAAEVYRDLLSSVNSVEDIDRKMAELSSAGKIDPAFLQITAKAYGHARDTNMTLDEAKWVSYRLFVKARDYFDRQQPKEKRIIEYLLTFVDRRERSNQLDMAVTPGPAAETDTHDYMWTTPQRLYAVIDGTLKAFDTMAGAAQDRLNAQPRNITPRKVVALRELRQEILKRYL